MKYLYYHGSLHPASSFDFSQADRQASDGRRTDGTTRTGFSCSPVQRDCCSPPRRRAALSSHLARGSRDDAKSVETDFEFFSEKMDGEATVQVATLPPSLSTNERRDGRQRTQYLKGTHNQGIELEARRLGRRPPRLRHEILPVRLYQFHVRCLRFPLSPPLPPPSFSLSHSLYSILLSRWVQTADGLDCSIFRYGWTYATATDDGDRRRVRPRPWMCFGLAAAAAAATIKKINAQ